MHIRGLRVFCDVVKRRSFSLAAADHGMTQSAASQTVQHLEDFLKVQLIDRSKRPFLLTSEGQRFFDGVSALIRQFDTLVNEIRQSGEEINGQIAISSIYSVGLSYLPAIEEAFKKHYPNVSYNVQYAHPHEVYRMVEQGTVDFGLISYPEASKTIQATHWRDERMVLVASPRHRLASQGTVSAAALSECGFVAFVPQLRIRQEVDRHLRAHGISGRVVVELDNIDSVKHAVMVNSGIAVLPERTVQQEVGSNSIRILDCPGLDITRPLGIIQRRSVAVSRPARAFLELLMSDVAVDVSPEEIVGGNGSVSKRSHEPVSAK
jgi:DNA-binding transcriptional LysR family regulator